MKPEVKMMNIVSNLDYWIQGVGLPETYDEFCWLILLKHLHVIKVTIHKVQHAADLFPYPYFKNSQLIAIHAFGLKENKTQLVTCTKRQCAPKGSNL